MQIQENGPRVPSITEDTQTLKHIVFEIPRSRENQLVRKELILYQLPEGYDKRYAVQVRNPKNANIVMYDTMEKAEEGFQKLEAKYKVEVNLTSIKIAQ